MQLAFSKNDENFRDEVRKFLEECLPADLRRKSARMTSVYADPETSLAWQAILVRKGWAVPSWPVEYGGCDWNLAQHYIWEVEQARVGAPPLSPMGLRMCAPALIGFGSSDQKSRFLPRMLSGEDFWCQGYSEPHAGSDLAALSMSAIKDENGFVCSGTKIWTTHAHEANWMFCLVRTEKTSKPQDGITFLLIDMTVPGISVVPIVTLTGEHIQNQVFFDEVRVPNANIVGEIGEGWRVAKYLLEFERGGSTYGPNILRRLGDIRYIARSLGELEGAFACKLAEAESDATALEMSELMHLSVSARDSSPGPKASMHKVLGTELSQRVTELSLELAGNFGLPFQPEATNPGGSVAAPPVSAGVPVGPDAFLTSAARYFNDRAGTIYAGSTEIQKNILAKRLLGL